MLRNGIKNKSFNKKRSKTKRIAIKITGTKFEIKKKIKSNDVG
jgi:hypothetical protein